MVSRLTVVDVGEFVRYDSCQRRLRLSTHNRAEAQKVPFYERLFNTIDPVLQKAGERREQEWEAQLSDAGFARYEPRSSEDGPSWPEVAEAFAAAQVGTRMYAREVTIEGEVGPFEVAGRMDFVVLHWINDKPRLRIVEGKASRKDRTYHRIQLALYVQLLFDYLTGRELVIGGSRLNRSQIEGVVARIDEDSGNAQPLLDLPARNLETELADVLRLLDADGLVASTLGTPLDQLPYRLEAKCDDCVFAVHCLPESARLRGLELLGIEAADARSLRGAGISTLDALAESDPDDPHLQQLRQTGVLQSSPEVLREAAVARRKTLPGGEMHPDEYEVTPRGGWVDSLLPAHDQLGRPLIRVFLVVEYDYVEDRVGALAAHVTADSSRVETGFSVENGRWVPDPQPYGRGPVEDKTTLSGVDVVTVQAESWSHDYQKDAAAEQELLQRFVKGLTDAIRSTAIDDLASVHFYVWSPNDVKHLVNACARVATELLTSLRELLGCRDSLEQLIFSSLRDEIANRYALGWTSTGLIPTVTLRWFGQRYHWVRDIAGGSIDLERAFEQDLFDFKTDLRLAPDGSWATDQAGALHKFEVRARFNDSLSAPYWRARWGELELDFGESVDQRVKSAVQRYQRAAAPGLLEGYLAARTLALRWLEERIPSKNNEIEKPQLDVGAIANFTLEVARLDRASLDFLRLDHHVHAADWIAAGMRDPRQRIASGTAIPLVNVRPAAQQRIQAEINLDGFGLSLEELERRTSFEAGGYVRVSRAHDDPRRGQSKNMQTRAGWTAAIESIDWTVGHIELSPRSTGANPNAYALLSLGSNADPMEHAILTDSLTDFVAPRVDRRIGSHDVHSIFDWLDPTTPTLPNVTAQASHDLAVVESVLSTLDVGDGQNLFPTQKAAVLDGLGARGQLLLGPPGTGKTTTTAAAILSRVLAKGTSPSVILVAGATHRAVDTLLAKVAELEPAFRTASSSVGGALPTIRVAKIGDSGPPTLTLLGGNPGITLLKSVSESVPAVAIVGGTTSGVLRLAERVDPTNSGPLLTDLLVVDEASMMPLAHFLALGTLINEESGEFLLAGDHRQLQPIVHHDWEEEDRPPAQIFQPHLSAYAALHQLALQSQLSAHQLVESPLTHSFRLPTPVRELIARVYAQDAVALTGPTEEAGQAADSDDPLLACWERRGLFLAVHDESQSRNANAVEVEIIRALCERGSAIASEDSVAVITPHRAQRRLLHEALDGFVSVGVVDTVERLQGGERPTVIVSGTASDPGAIAHRAEFLLSLNRANVAFSRAQHRLIVVCSRSLIDHIPSDSDLYEAAALWKAVRATCNVALGEVGVSGYRVELFRTDSEALQTARVAD